MARRTRPSRALPARVVAAAPAARRPIFEPLEDRRLMTAVAINVNFQATSTPDTPAGYIADTGWNYRTQANGLTYGWNVKNTANGVDRNSGRSPDNRYDTHNSLYTHGRWSIDLPNGRYEIRIVAGDPNSTNGIYKINAEDVLAVDGRQSSASRWVDQTAVVEVTDGTLTLSTAAGAYQNKLAFLEIRSADSGGGETPEDPPPPPPPTVPSAAGSLVATASGTTGVSLTWNDGSDNETGFRVERQTAGGAWQAIGAVGAGVTTYADTGLTPGTTYAYRVIAFNAVGNGAASPTATVTTPEPPPSGQPAFSVSINFQPSSTATPAGYIADTGWNYKTQANGLTYGWNVKNTANAVDRNSSRSPDDRFDTHNSLYTHGRWSIDVPNGRYHVRIVAGDPNTTNGVFKINAEDVLAVDGRQSSATRWVDQTAVVDVTDGALTLTSAAGAYQNRLAFVEIRSVDSTEPEPEPGDAPAAPTNVQASVKSSTRVELSWQDASDDETGFRVERSDNGGAWTQVASLGANVTGWVDTSAVGGRTYLYRVRGVNGAGASAASAQGVAVTPIGAGWTPLFNGRDLDGFYTYLPSTGRVDAPAANPTGVFAVHDGMLHVLNVPATSAEREFGYVATKRSYGGSYHLSLEYMWGTKKFAPRLTEKRDSGVIFHLTDDADASAGRVWPTAGEVQVQEGDTGDVWLLHGAAGDTTVASTTSSPRRFQAGGTPYAFAGGGDRYSQLEAGASADSLTGWNRVELYVTGDVATVLVNGQVVNQVWDLRRPDPSNPDAWLEMLSGRIALQAEGAEVYYRNMQVRELPATAAPHGATPLFDGTGTGAWRKASSGAPIGWNVRDGELVVAPGTGDIRTADTYRDFKLHVEFNVPHVSPGAAEQDRGNSGIYLQGRYEVQILDSFGRSLADANDLGAIYGQRNAATNAALPAGMWQSYDITFTAARWSASGQKLSDARVTVVLNGVTVHDDVALPTNTAFGAPESPADGPILLQDHGNAVRFRNVWIQAL